MFFKKPLFIQNIKPKTIFTIFLWFVVAWVLSKPLQEIGKTIYSSIGLFTNNTFEVITHGKSITEELITSKKLVKEQEKTISLLKIRTNYLESQNKNTNNLKELLNLKRNIRYKTISASVIGRSPDSWHKQIVLDKGEDLKIKSGDSIVSAKGIIGQVIEVNRNTSVVQLISDPSYRLGCKIKKRNIFGILSGKTNSIGLLEFIPVGSKVKVGDLIETSGIASRGLFPSYPPGHLVGKISKISKKKSKASDLYIEVTLSENLNSISDVLVFSPD
ncbi:MAG: rod shape-determining protein MreC [Candidatus Melainabacteria bacterium RIFCSPLOWO2_02_FULL_35_15]|nr:MAG: rod shape-determining protein MreC [Candidatus Melainabacteria bacterium RIFCSPLOWO2_12_FULL_35_11]OGI13557.1 MAG: rod shape-determining protein MreC [Candidatus Melainabacteria bacterium RIFCSPLOWO2_02_FULL_35_15]